MKEVIEQIALIDEVAFENEQKNKGIIAEEEINYQNKMQNYREQQIMEAHRLAETNYTKIIEAAKAEVSEKTAKSAKEIERLKIQVSVIEKEIIHQIFQQLFLIEKEG